MTEIGYVGPKVAIFDSRGTLLHESTDTKGFADRSLKYIIGSLRKVQRETNQFLTKLVNEQNPQNTCQNETDAVEGKHKKESNH